MASMTKYNRGQQARIAFGFLFSHLPVLLHLTATTVALFLAGWTLPALASLAVQLYYGYMVNGRWFKDYVEALDREEQERQQEREHDEEESFREAERERLHREFMEW